MSISRLIANFARHITSGAKRDQKNVLAKNQVIDFVHEDKQLFEVLCQFVWIQGDPLPLIFDLENEVYIKQGMTLSGLKRLEALGLIELDSSGFVKKGLGKHTRLFYCGKPTKIGFPGGTDNSLDLGHVLFTARGKQLFSSTVISRNQKFYEYVIQRWFRQGMVLASIQIDRK